MDWDFNALARGDKEKQKIFFNPETRRALQKDIEYFDKNRKQFYKTAVDEDIKKQRLKAGFRVEGEGSLLERAGDFAREAFVEAPVTFAKGIGDVAKGQAAADILEKITTARNDWTKRHSAYLATLSEADYDKPEVKRKLRQFENELKRIDVTTEPLSDAIKQSSAVDPVKTAAAGAETALNVGGFGLLRGVAKGVSKQLVREGAETAARPSLLRAAGQLGTEGALYGGASGVATTGRQRGSEVTAEELATNAGVGAVVGGVLGGALPVAAAGVRKAGVATEQSLLKKAAERQAEGYVPAGKMTLKEKASERLLNRYSALSKSDRDVMKDMIAKGEAKNIPEAQQKLRVEGRSTEALVDEIKSASVRGVQNIKDKSVGQRAIGKARAVEDVAIDANKRGDTTEFMQYMTDLFDRQARSTTKKKIQSELDDTALSARIADFETRNADRLGEVQDDVKLIKQWGDDILDKDVKFGGLPKDTADYIKKTYKDVYVPINRLFDEEGVIRPEIAGGLKQSGKDIITRFLSGGKAPIDLSFDPIVQRAVNAERHLSINKLNQEIARRADAGLIDAKRVVKSEVTAQQKAAEDKLRVVEQDLSEATGKDVKKLKAERKAIREEIRSYAQPGPERDGLIRSLASNGEQDIVQASGAVNKSLANLSSNTSMDKVIRLLGAPSNALKTTFTGNPILAPSFAAAKAVFNPMLMAITTDAKWTQFVNPDVYALAVQKSFRDSLKENGAKMIGATEVGRTPTTSTDLLVAKGAMKDIAKHPIVALRSIGKAMKSWEGIKSVGANISNAMNFVDNAYRTLDAAAVRQQYLKEATKRGVAKGLAEDQANKLAAIEFNEVLGNFERSTQVVRALEAVLPYSTAGQVGVSAIGRKLRTNPVRTSARLAVIGTALGAGVSQAFRDTNYAEFLQEQYDYDRSYNADGFLYFPNPLDGGIHKDDKGNWTGFWKVRLPADFRPLMGLFNRGMLDQTTGSNRLTPDFILGALTQMGTGGIGANMETGKLDPAGEAARGPYGLLIGYIAGKNLATGEDLKTPADFATAIGGDLGTGIGWLTDYGNAFVDEDGNLAMREENAGEFVKAALQRYGAGVASIPARLFTTTKGVTGGSKIYKDTKEILKGMDEKTLNQYQQLHTFDKDDDNASLFYTQDRANMFLANPKLFELEKRVAELRNKHNGKPIDPLFLVPNKKDRNTILTKQSIPSQVGTANIDPAFYDSLVYKEYQDALSKYYPAKDAWKKKMGYKVQEPENPYPAPDKAVQSKIDAYYNLPSSYAKGAYKKANPDLMAHFNRIAAWEEKQRQRYNAATEVELYDKYAEK